MLTFHQMGPGVYILELDFYFQGRLYSYPPYEAHVDMKSKIANWILHFFCPEKRHFQLNLRPFGGNDWWSISFEAAQYIIRFIDANPEYLKFHKRSFMPSEGFFQTILLNAKDQKLTSKIINNNYRMIDWADGGKHPKIFSATDYQTLIRSEKLFARKFDMQVDADILDILNKYLNE